MSSNEKGTIQSSSSSSLDEAAIEAVMLLQRHVFAQQLTVLSELSHRFPASVDDVDVIIPELLLRRAQCSADMIRNDQSSDSYGLAGHPGRLVQNDEIALMDILDADGMVSTSPRLTDFVLLMSRVAKMETRMLCLHILGRRLSPTCATTFVKYSGFRLLRRWLKIAEDEGRLGELRMIVVVCKILPFDATAVRDSEIGKAIKKLLKYRPPAITSASYHSDNGNTAIEAELALLVDEVKKLMKKWTEQINAAASGDGSAEASKEKPSEALDPTKLPKFVFTLAARLDRDHKLSASTSSSSTTDDIQILSKPSSISKLSLAPPGATITSIAQPLTLTLPTTMAAKMQLANHQQQSNKSAVAISIPSTSSQSLSAIVNAATSPATSSAASNPISWLTSSTALDAVTPSASTSASSRPARERKNDAMVEEAKRQLALREMQAAANPTPSIVSEVPNAGLVPGPSALKRKADGQLQPAKKRAKMSIQWADEGGGALKEVFTFEVDKIRSTISGYKSHKDLVKKEKQLEKDAHTMKIHDTMTKIIDYKEPSLLPLSIDILDTINAPVNSLEKAIQDKRIAHMLETRFLDDSLIPNDPDTSPSAYTNDPSALPSNTMVVIPWHLPGEHVIAEAMIEPISYHHMHQQAVSSYQALPEILRPLDPAVLTFLANNEAYVSYLLRDDGSIDESRLHALQVNVLGEHMMNNNYHNKYNHMAVPVSNNYNTMSMPATSWQPSHMTSASMQPTYTPPAPSFPTFSVPSLTQLTAASANNTGMSGGYNQPPRYYPPPPQPMSVPVPMPVDLAPKKGAKGSVACRMFNTPEGCRFGDRCDFAHVGMTGPVMVANTVNNRVMGGPTASTNKNRAGPGGQHRHGPGGR